MADFNIPKRGSQYIFYVGLVSRATGMLQNTPTIAAGDFKVSIDGGAFANLATLPTVTPAAGEAVKITLSTSEMTGDNIFVKWQDAAGAEWVDGSVCIQTGTYSVGDLATPTDVKSKVVEALATDTYAEPGQGNPASNISLAAKIGYTYKWRRNKRTNDGATVKFFADDASTVDQKAAVSDAAGTTTIGEIGTGP